jgi:ATP/ADP translocase/CRP-like cAMP-binding protein/HEAT repeat protein
MSDRPAGSLLNRLISPFAQVREGEGLTAFLMFTYSFLAMTSYNIVKPITRSQFISSLGADNLPWVQFGSGILIGVVMQFYSRAIAAVPRRWTIPVTQTGMVVLLVTFWVLFTQVRSEWISVGFYFYGLILGLLLISQFWTLANDVYDPRQAKRLFGFIGGGSSLGGATGAALTRFLVEELGTNNMLLVSAAILTGCFFIVTNVLRREKQAGKADYTKTGEEEGVSGGEAIKLLRESRHLQIIAMVIAFAAIGAAIIEQQLNMATAEQKTSTDAITAFLAEVTIYLSLVGLAVQVLLTSRIHRFLGIGFALMILPMGLGTTAVIMLFNSGLWAPGLARVLDTSLRYTVDKTTREILFLPLPGDIKYRAKPFVDVTVDRLSKGLGALLLLVLIKEWGFNLSWQQLSYASLTVMALWVFAALRARREYLLAFRRSIEQQHVEAAEIRIDTADLSSLETLVEELGQADPKRVVYAIDLLEALDKRNLVTPLLLSHSSPAVRARALRVAEEAGPRAAERWATSVEHALKDPDGDVRLAAVRTIAAIRREGAADIMRPYLSDSDPRLVVTAATALASSPVEADAKAAEDAFERLIDDTREQSAPIRLDIARALGQVGSARFRPQLIPLIYDSNLAVAREAIQSAGKLGASDYLFVPALVSLLRHRRLKSTARQVLVGYGEGVVDALVYFLHDTEEDPWVRRHVPSTLALIPTQRSMDVLLEALADPDGFVRYKAGAAIERLHRDHADLKIDKALVDNQVLVETTRAFSALTLHHNLFTAGGFDPTSLLARALNEKHERAISRVFRLLGLVHDPGGIHAVRETLRRGDARARSSAFEYVDNLLSGAVRRRVMLLIEDMPIEERIRKGNVLYKTRVRDVEDTVVQLVHDEDQVIAAAAIHFVEEQQMWKLADDLEHVLEHRDVHDWYVFEAASWALAAQRMPAERRRALWLEPLPAVELAERLRHIKLFDFASVVELFRIAGLGRQVRYEAGRVLYERGEAPGALQFLLDGRLTATSGNGVTQALEPPCPLAFDEVLEGGVMPVTIRAAETSICLSLTTEEFLSLLSENVEIAQGIFRLLIETRDLHEWRTVIHGKLSPELERKVGSDGLQPIDRVLLLQASPMLSRATAPELLGLAAIARNAPLRRGTDPLGGGSEPSLLVVLSGAVAVDRDDGVSDVAESGDAIGIYETLGGAPISAKAQVTEEGSALRWHRSDLFDLLADHVELLQAIYSGLLRGKLAPTDDSPVETKHTHS